MTDISKRLEQTLRSVIQKAPILPVKVADGILVGNVLITSNGSLKDLWQHDSVVYREVSLNKVAIKLANMLAKHGNSYQTDTIYKADQEYGRWFIESQMLRTQYQKAVNNQDYDRSDVLWARYSESRDKVIAAKVRAETLASF